MQPDKLETKTNAKSKVSLKTRGRPKKVKENIAKVLDDEKVLLGLRVAFLEEVIRNQKLAIESDIEDKHCEVVAELRRQVDYRDTQMIEQTAVISRQSRLIDKTQDRLDSQLNVDTEKEVEARMRSQKTKWTQFSWSAGEFAGPLADIAAGVSRV